MSFRFMSFFTYTILGSCSAYLKIVVSILFVEASLIMISSKSEKVWLKTELMASDSRDLFPLYVGKIIETKGICFISYNLKSYPLLYKSLSKIFPIWVPIFHPPSQRRRWWYREVASVVALSFLSGITLNFPKSILAFLNFE